jgi:hypothetical protein
MTSRYPPICKGQKTCKAGLAWHLRVDVGGGRQAGAQSITEAHCRQMISSAVGRAVGRQLRLLAAAVREACLLAVVSVMSLPTALHHVTDGGSCRLDLALSRQARLEPGHESVADSGSDAQHFDTSFRPDRADRYWCLCEWQVSRQDGGHQGNPSGMLNSRNAEGSESK